MRRKIGSPAVAIASLALFLALGGTAVAAHHFLITSTSQIKPSVLSALHGKTGRTGAPGAAGAVGPPGPAGTTNLSALTSIEGPTVEVPSGEVGAAVAVCPTGSHAVAGGGSASVAGIDVSEMESSHQDWFILTANETGITIKIHAEVECANAGAAVVARTPGTVHASPERLSLEKSLRSALLSARPIASAACARDEAATIGVRKC